MDNKQAKRLTDRIFAEIIAATSIKNLESVLEDDELQNKRMKTEKYPRIVFKIKYDEILKYLNKDGNLVNDTSKISDPLAKLLYALSWKNGDLEKVKHIVEGIKEVENHSSDKNDGLVFYQFGKYLTKKNGEPIIDQHVIRAFKVFKCENNHEIESIRKLELLNKGHKEDILAYKDWLKNSNPKLIGHDDYTYNIDQILFALGKTIKFKKIKVVSV